MEMRTCRYCGDEHPLESFEIAKTINGKRYRRWRCCSCYRAVKTKRKKSIKKWLTELKQGRACKHCGIDDVRVLDFHHRKGTNKIFHIGNAIRGYSKKTILDEIDKCETICANCHRIHHWEDRHRPVQSVKRRSVA